VIAFRAGSERGCYVISQDSPSISGSAAYRGQISLPNVVIIVSKEWLNWLRRVTGVDRAKFVSPHGYESSFQPGERAFLAPDGPSKFSPNQPRRAPKMSPEIKRGLKEGHLHFETLRSRWPRAFPYKRHEVRPLASSVAPMVAAELQWSEPFARGVLKRWKSGEWYCRACLVHLTRIAIDGSQTEETVDDEARAMARQQIEWLKAKRNARAAPAEPLRPQPPALKQPDDDVPPLVEERKRDGFAALREAHGNRTVGASP
jgi:ProQ/FINO family